MIIAPKTSKRFLWLFITCLVPVLSGCGDSDQQAAEAPVRAVRSIVVNADNTGQSRTFSGTLHASQETKLSFKVSGAIEEIAVNVGDMVKKGDIVAQLDATPYELQAQQANASLVSAQAERRNAKSNYERVKNLYEGGNASKNELDNARASAETTTAMAQSNRKTLEIARLNVAYTKLKMDDDCAIASVDAEEGENVTSGTQIFHATCGDELEVRLDIPETVIGYIKKEMPVQVRFSALKGKKFQARVTEVGVSAVDGGTTFPVTVVLNELEQDDLKTGLSADVIFSFKAAGSQKQAVVVPSFALTEDETGRFVFIVEDQQGKAVIRRQNVTVGSVLQSGIEILSGLEPGMRVVTAGVSVLREGMEVKYFDE